MTTEHDPYQSESVATWPDDCGNPDDYIFVIDAGDYYNPRTGEKISHRRFPDVFPRYDMGQFTQPGRRALRAEYRPDLRGSNSPVVSDENKTAILNTYREPSFRHIEGAWNHPAFVPIRRHFEVLFPNEVERRLVIDWCAFQVQNPSKKIRWVLCILGPQGSGKSMLLEVLKSSLGPFNWRLISNSVFDSKWNEWFLGSRLGIIEELHQVGESKHRALNAIKEVATNDIAATNIRNVGAGQARNFINLVALTNHENAVPIDDEDRRWCILETAFKTKAEVQEQLPSFYFNELSRALQNHDLIHSALMQWEVSRDFPVNGPAPDTEAKKSMKFAALGKVPMALRDLLNESDTNGIWPRVFSGKMALEYLREKLRYVVSARDLKKAADILEFKQVGRCEFKDNVTDRFTKHRWYAHTSTGLMEAKNDNASIPWAQLEPFANHVEDLAS